MGEKSLTQPMRLMAACGAPVLVMKKAPEEGLHTFMSVFMIIS